MTRHRRDRDWWHRTRSWAIPVAALGAAGALIGGATTVPTPTATTASMGLTATPTTTTVSNQYCGAERAAVKHLTDGATLTAPTVMTVDQLRALTAPAVTSSSPRLPQEHTLVALQNVRVIAAKQEADSDLHIILQGATGEMNVEAPMAVCDASSPYAAQLAAARAALDKALGPVSSSSYTPENLVGNFQGVLFFDVLHGQRGADNGVELHPVLAFSPG